ncbi:RNA/RNP complex-1-interacting phosphatase-like [Dysidea avara]|uniref:RNA/RNP complex-1-interacting phosphatase-like n=1 Tax=Dysidea avara TaxID=196820 RepID=UPI00332B1DFC
MKTWGLEFPTTWGRFPCRIPTYPPISPSERPREYSKTTTPVTRRFTPTQLVGGLKKNGLKLGLVVDLTHTSIYYDPREFEQFGVQHIKVECPGKVVPSADVYKKFAGVIRSQLALPDPGVVVVHCTHGVNRTGYLICKFLIDHFKYSSDDAIKTFSKSRGYSMEYKNYLDDLQEYWQCSCLS